MLEQVNKKQFKQGECLGASDWLVVTQEMIDSFGRSTLDVEPLHMDPVWCAQNSPYGKPIVYGFQTISLLSHLFHNATNDRFAGAEGTQNFPLNYGFDSLRLLSPVRVGSAIRGRFILTKVRERHAGELLLTVEATVSIEDQSKPALVADWLMMLVTDAGRQSVTRATDG